MKNKEVRGILALIVVTALSFGVIAGSRALSVDMTGDGAQGVSAAVAEELDVSGAETIEEAARLEDGAYAVTVRTAGYAGDIVMRVTFEDDAETIRQVEVLEQNETETLGSRITEPEFLARFAGAKAPVYLPGMTVEAADASGESGALPVWRPSKERSIQTQTKPEPFLPASPMPGRSRFGKHGIHPERTRRSML